MKSLRNGRSEPRIDPYGRNRLTSVYFFPKNVGIHEFVFKQLSKFSKDPLVRPFLLSLDLRLRLFSICSFLSKPFCLDRSFRTFLDSA